MRAVWMFWRFGVFEIAREVFMKGMPLVAFVVPSKGSVVR